MSDSPNNSRLPSLVLNRREERRLRRGHLWVFSNEVDTERSPLKGFAAGDEVNVVTHGGTPLGSAYVNPHALICARLYSRRTNTHLDAARIAYRLADALALREARYPTPHYRLCYGETDGLPGLVVDRYGDVLVAQLTTAGMERRRGAIIDALDSLLSPAAIVLRNDTAARQPEGLEAVVETVLGTLPERLEIDEGGVHFTVPSTGGQKTGWFYDQRANRDAFVRYVAGKRVLDLFSYVGAWGVRAAVAGAGSVVCVDSSAPALETLAANAEANGVGGIVATGRGDVFEALRSMRDDGERFDVVVVDPPALIKRRKDHRAGLEAYRRLNRLALKVLTPGGTLVSCSCSFHLSRDDLRGAMERAALQEGAELQILEQGHAGPDHPVHPAIPESDYLKSYTARVLQA